VYSDVEFVIPPKRTRKSNPNGDQERGAPRKIYAAKKLLTRCEYFHAMFNGGFREVEGVIEEVSRQSPLGANKQEEDEEEYDVLSDSDVEDEASDQSSSSSQPIQIARAPSRSSTLAPRRSSTSRDGSPIPDEVEGESVAESNDEATSTPGEVHAEEPTEFPVETVPAKKDTVPSTPGRREVGGPKKTRVMIRDAAWSTWWAVLYWVS
jgi:hypothetical protein